MFTSQSFFSKLTVCAAEYRIYSVVSRGLQSFFIISWGSQSRAAYILYFCTLWKGLDDAQSFLGYILSTKPSFAFDFLQHHVHIRHRRDYDEQKAVVAKGADRGGAEGAQAPPLAIRILMFIFLVIHQLCKSRSGVLQNVLRQYHTQWWV